MGCWCDRRSGEFGRINHSFDVGDTVFEGEFAFFQARKHQTVIGRSVRQCRDGGVEVAVFGLELRQGVDPVGRVFEVIKHGLVKVSSSRRRRRELYSSGLWYASSQCNDNTGPCLGA
jgi:hypothetical protein